MRSCVKVLLLCVLLGMGSFACAETEKGTVTASALVIRQGPGLEHAMLGEVPQGAVLDLLSFENGWYAVQYDGATGYVHARYIRVALPGTYGESSGALPTAAPQTDSQINAPAPIAAGTALPGSGLPELAFTGENNPNYPRILKPGDMGNSVIDLQVTLQHMGYLGNTLTDGQFGYDTQAGVMKLQRVLGIDADGLIGPQTRRLIGNNTPGEIELLDFWLGGSVAYARLTEATICDVWTGRRFQISRYGGDNHIDAEPLTAADTATMLSIIGGEWTWDRRPIWLEVNGRVIAASMNCMPHGGQHIFDNNCNGQFCIHLLNSRTHETDRVDEGHTAYVMEAWNKRDQYVAVQ